MKKRFKEAMPPRHRLWQQRRKQRYTELLLINDNTGCKKVTSYQTSDFEAAERCHEEVRRMLRMNKNLQLWYRYYEKA